MGHKLFMAKRRELLVYAAVFVYCTALFLKRVNLPLSESALNEAMQFVAVIAVLSIFFDRKIGIRQLIVTALIAGLLLIDSIPSGNHEILYLFCIIWSCRNVNSRVIIKYVFNIVLIMTCLVALLTFCGVIQNELFIQNGIRRRYALGYSSWTILPFQYFSMCMMYLYLSRKKIRLWRVFFLALIGGIIGVLTDTKSACIITLLGMIGIYFGDHIHIKKWENIRFLILSPQIFTLLTLATIYLYNKEINFFKKLNILLNYRISLSSNGFSRFGVHLLANPSALMASDEYTYIVIDNNYLNLLLTWGLVGLGTVLFIFSCIIRYSIENRDMKLLIVLMFMLINALVWSRLLVLIEAEVLFYFSRAFSSSSTKKEELTCVEF